ncbi:MAG: hypothetical protein WAW37_03995 [Syntrophobacteraceae bacterium]
MYSPKINEDFIPALYRLAKERKKPMTQLVNGIISQYLADQGKEESHVSDRRHSGATPVGLSSRACTG